MLTKIVYTTEENLFLFFICLNSFNSASHISIVYYFIFVCELSCWCFPFTILIGLLCFYFSPINSLLSFFSMQFICVFIWFVCCFFLFSLLCTLNNDTRAFTSTSVAVIIITIIKKKLPRRREKVFEEWGESTLLNDISFSSLSFFIISIWLLFIIETKLLYYINLLLCWLWWQLHASLLMVCPTCN